MFTNAATLDEPRLAGVGEETLLPGQTAAHDAAAHYALVQTISPQLTVHWQLHTFLLGVSALFANRTRVDDTGSPSIVLFSFTSRCCCCKGRNMQRPSMLLLLILSLIGPLETDHVLTCGFCDEAADAAFRPLFNGRDLTGWVLVNTPPQTWEVQDQMLICSGKPIGEIRTDRMYQNFILELEWRHMVPAGNAGVFVWADDITARGVPFHRSIEVQVLDHGYGQSAGHTTHGDIFPIHGATMTPLNGRGGGSRAFPTEERSKPSPEWNRYRIECRNGEISLAVNGAVVTRGKDASPRKGYICLESEGGVVHYRNIRIQELPDTPIEPQHMAIANRGFRSLYTGLDLSGWKIADDGRSHWKVQDWVLAYDGGAAEAEAVLETEESFRDFGFILDLKGSDSFKQLDLMLSGQIIATVDDSTSEGGQRTQWRRVEGTVRGDMLNLTVDGRPVVTDVRVSVPNGSLGLKAVGAASFCNLYVRSLAD